MSQTAVSLEPDVHSSSPEYADRFGNQIGIWMLEVQERAVMAVVPHESLSVLDVGGGHAQVTQPLIDAGKSVTVLGSASVCAAQLKRYLDVGTINFKVGSLLRIPFPDQSFDTVICLRILSHTHHWEALIAELCRVAKKNVIIDYPVWLSVNFLSPLLFQLKRRLEGNTRTFTLFSSRSIRTQFKKNQFERNSEFKQFFFPMALHRMLQNVPASQNLENIARKTGTTSLFGSPVIASYSRW